jgi:hypothetical protein
VGVSPHASAQAVPWDELPETVVRRQVIMCSFPGLPISEEAPSPPPPAPEPPPFPADAEPALHADLGRSEGGAVELGADVGGASRPEGRMLDLLIKNVTRGARLEPAELEEIRGIKASAGSTEVWEQWLEHARCGASAC